MNREEWTMAESPVCGAEFKLFDGAEKGKSSPVTTAAPSSR